MPQSGWPTLGGAGASRSTARGRGDVPGEALRDGRVRGRGGGAPGTPLPPAPNRLDAGLLTLLTGGVGAPRDDGDGDGGWAGPPPGPGGGRGGATPGAGLFGAPQGGMMGPGGGMMGPVGITMHQHQGLGGTAPTHQTHQRPGFGGQGLGRRRRRRRRRLRRAVPRGGADVGPPAFFAGGDVSGGDTLARALDRVQIEPPNEPGARRAAARRRRRRRRTAARAARFRAASGAARRERRRRSERSRRASARRERFFTLAQRQFRGRRRGARGRREEPARASLAPRRARRERREKRQKQRRRRERRPARRRSQDAAQASDRAANEVTLKVLVSFLCFLFSARRFSGSARFDARETKFAWGRGSTRSRTKSAERVTQREIQFHNFDTTCTCAGAQNISN